MTGDDIIIPIDKLVSFVIHGHFYQPPREDPWTGKIPKQVPLKEGEQITSYIKSFHDWNDRICTECYERNISAGIYGPNGKTIAVVNNLEYMSFNFGPTLLEWMENTYPLVYKRIIDADSVSRKANNGHGNAIAQVYNHIIMPLANRHDKELQVKWGKSDFEWRFGRKPEAMWLAETAVDTETLEVLVDNGLKYVILSPYQAQTVIDQQRNISVDVRSGKIDPTESYYVHLPNNKQICAFFYDGPLSARVGFQHLLKNSETFATQLKNCVNYNKLHSGVEHIVNTAWDGETSGWHENYGNRALAYLFYNRAGFGLKFTNYANYLENHPPTKEVIIRENSAWSDFDGLSRWGGAGGGRMGIPDWFDQKWRPQLRETLNWLRDQLDNIYVQSTKGILKDPWNARLDYLSVNNQIMSIDDFFAKHGKNSGLSHEDKLKALDLMDMQKNIQLMFTSCGWFFEDISRIEPMQNLSYAARAIQLANRHIKTSLEDELKNRLSTIRSNYGKDAKQLYDEEIKKKIHDLGYRQRKNLTQKMQEKLVGLYEKSSKDILALARSKAHITPEKMEWYELLHNVALRSYTETLSDFNGPDRSKDIIDLFYISNTLGFYFHAKEACRTNVYDGLQKMVALLDKNKSCLGKNLDQRFLNLIHVAENFNFDTTSYRAKLCKQHNP